MRNAGVFFLGVIVGLLTVSALAQSPNEFGIPLPDGITNNSAALSGACPPCPPCGPADLDAEEAQKVKKALEAIEQAEKASQAYEQLSQ